MRPCQGRDGQKSRPSRPVAPIPGREEEEEEGSAEAFLTFLSCSSSSSLSEACSPTVQWEGWWSGGQGLQGWRNIHFKAATNFWVTPGRGSHSRVAKLDWWQVPRSSYNNGRQQVWYCKADEALELYETCHRMFFPGPVRAGWVAGLPTLAASLRPSVPWSRPWPVAFSLLILPWLVSILNLPLFEMQTSDWYHWVPKMELNWSFSETYPAALSTPDPQDDVAWLRWVIIQTSAGKTSEVNIYCKRVNTVNTFAFWSILSSLTKRKKSWTEILQILGCSRSSESSWALPSFQTFQVFSLCLFWHWILFLRPI